MRETALADAPPSPPLAAPAPVLSWQGVDVRYPGGVGRPSKPALAGVSLNIARGQTVALLGPNGSGKSTLLKVALGLQQPQRGSCTVFGHPAGDRQQRTRLGYLPEGPFFYRSLTGGELVSWFGRLSGVPERGLAERARQLLHRVGLGQATDDRLATYSKGMLQRVGLAQALVHDPELLLLDEPTTGLDPEGLHDLARLLGELRAEGKTIVWCTHELPLVARLADAVAILAQGRLVWAGNRAAIAAAAAAAPGDGSSVAALPPERLDEALWQLYLRVVRPSAPEVAR